MKSVCIECSNTINPITLNCDNCRCSGCYYKVGCNGLTARYVIMNVMATCIVEIVNIW